MVSSVKESRQRAQWEWMQKIGYRRFVYQRTLIWVGASATFDALYFITSKLGLVKPPAGESIVDLVISGMVVGCGLGELEWISLKKKFYTRKRSEDPTMI
jgi:hypothetical protein